MYNTRQTKLTGMYGAMAFGWPIASDETIGVHRGRYGAISGHSGSDVA